MTLLDVITVLVSILVLASLPLPFIWSATVIAIVLTVYFFGPAILLAIFFRYDVHKAWGKNQVITVNAIEDDHMVNFYFPCNDEIDNWFKENGFKKSLFYSGYQIADDRLKEVGIGLHQLGCEYKTRYL